MTLREKTLLAIAEVHSGNGAEGERIADAAILALRQWLAGEGLVVVPKTPSEDQFRAGSTFRFTVETHGYKDTAGIYEAMIAAAPDALKAPPPAPSPGAITGIRKAETPCSDCIDGWCQMNCGRASNET